MAGNLNPKSLKSPGPRPAKFLSRHPSGLASLFFTEMWERFSYYGMRALLTLFLVAAPTAGGLGMTTAEAAMGVRGRAARGR